jgi:hypothetical protein
MKTKPYQVYGRVAVPQAPCAYPPYAYPVLPAPSFSFPGPGAAQPSAAPPGFAGLSPAVSAFPTFPLAAQPVAKRSEASHRLASPQDPDET